MLRSLACVHVAHARLSSCCVRAVVFMLLTCALCVHGAYARLCSCCARSLVLMLRTRGCVYVAYVRLCSCCLLAIVFILRTCACVHAAYVRLCSCCEGWELPNYDKLRLGTSQGWEIIPCDVSLGNGCEVPNNIFISVCQKIIQIIVLLYFKIPVLRNGRIAHIWFDSST